MYFFGFIDNYFGFTHVVDKDPLTIADAAVASIHTCS